MGVDRFLRLGVALIASAALSLGLAACDSPQVALSDSAGEILSMKLAEDVSAQGVLLAAVLLSTADIEAALADGLVTPAEVDLAQKAIDDGLLDQWRERAERDLTEQ